MNFRFRLLFLPVFYLLVFSFSLLGELHAGPEKFGLTPDISSITKEKAIWTITLIFTVAALIIGGVLFRNRRLSTEIKERQKAESALRENEEKFRDLIEALPQAVFEMDLTGQLTYVNRHAINTFGYTDDDVARGLNAFELIVPEDRPRAMENTRLILAGQGKEGNEYTLIRKDGRKTPILISSKPIWKSGQPVGLRGVIVDLSEQKQREEHEIKFRKLESLGILAGGIAHDFNNILTAVLGNITLAKLTAGPNRETALLLDEAEKATGRAKDLTRQLLTFAKGGAPVRESASIEELMTDTAEFSLHGSRAGYELQAADDLWDADIDISQIGQVFQNLFINGSQAMPEGGVITVRMENRFIPEDNDLGLTTGRYLAITFEDHGTGIPQSSLSKIFDPYYTTKSTGSGLGLATAYSIISRHNGSITVESEPGKGTVFHILLPAAETTAIRKPPLEEKAVVKGGGGRKILLMDDEEIVTETVSTILSYLGYQVESAKDGRAAIDLFRKAWEADRPFSVSIMDLTVPGGMGGVEATGKILEIDPQARIIVASGYANDPVMADYARYGFCGFIHKPFDVKELATALDAVIQDDQTQSAAGQ